MIASSRNGVYIPHVGESDAAVRDLEERVRKMRELGVTKWGDIELGSPPQPEASATTQQPKSPAEIEHERRVQRRSVALAASGALVPRIVQDRE